MSNQSCYNLGLLKTDNQNKQITSSKTKAIKQENKLKQNQKQIKMKENKTPAAWTMHSQRVVIASPTNYKIIQNVQKPYPVKVILLCAFCTAISAVFVKIISL